jgi:hypothetical protein
VNELFAGAVPDAVMARYLIQDRLSLARFSMPPGPDNAITASFDLSVDDIDDVGGAREAIDQIGEHPADGDCGDWQGVGAHGRILLDCPRQGVARNLNDHLLLTGKWVFRHAISSRSTCVMLSNVFFSGSLEGKTA